MWHQRETEFLRCVNVDPRVIKGSWRFYGRLDVDPELSTGIGVIMAVHSGPVVSVVSTGIEVVMGVVVQVDVDLELIW